MKAFATMRFDERSAALMADQSALVIAGMLFGGCDLGETADCSAEPPADSAVDRDQPIRTATAASDMIADPFGAA
jgi:hypothetical protein